MQQRGFVVFLTCLLLSAMVSATNHTSDTSSTTLSTETQVAVTEGNDAQTGDEDSDLQDITSEQANEELGDGGSINGVDRFFDSIFSDDEAYSRERAAEIRTLIQAGKYEEAKALLKDYEISAQNYEKEVSPDEKEEAERRSQIIRKAYGDIIGDVPPEYRGDFNKIRVAEKKIGTAAEIAGKIKELCETLAKVDPDQYSRVCKTDDDAPQWQKKLDKDLTEEQKKEARAFIEIMTGCMQDASTCRCKEISVTAFADMCTQVAPLYALCQKGDEAKCEEADTLSEGIEDVLPPYLQEILEELDHEFEGAQFDNHMPPECKKAGATTREACMRVMLLESDETPDECKPALKEALDRGVKSEREFRKLCEEIMFKESAPQECIDAGITDGRACGAFMFKESAPQECIDAGLTGESPRDGKKCQEIMRASGKGGENQEGRGSGQGFNFDCRQLQNPDERLKCFDGAVSHFKEGPGGEGQGFEQRFRETKERERQCADSCLAQGGAWDFSGGKCSCRIDEQREGSRGFDPARLNEDERRRYENSMREREERDRGREEQMRRQREQEGQFQGRPPEGQFPPQGPPPGEQPSSTSTSSGTTSTGTSSTTTSSTTSSSTTGSGTSTSSGSSTATSTSSGSGTTSTSDTSATSTASSGSSSGTTVTGNVALDIEQGNGFLSYFFR